MFISRFSNFEKIRLFMAKRVDAIGSLYMCTCVKWDLYLADVLQRVVKSCNQLLQFLGSKDVMWSRCRDRYLTYESCINPFVNTHNNFFGVHLLTYSYVLTLFIIRKDALRVTNPYRYSKHKSVLVKNDLIQKKEWSYKKAITKPNLWQIVGGISPTMGCVFAVSRKISSTSSRRLTKMTYRPENRLNWNANSVLPE